MTDTTRVAVIIMAVGAVMCSRAPSKCMYVEVQGNYVAYEWENRKKDPIACLQATPMCRRNFKISYVKVPPYTHAGLLEDMIMNKCCNGCASLTTVNHFLNVSEVSFSKINTSDFIFPFLGKSSSVKLHGFYFIPIVDVPNVFYFTEKYRSLVANLILDCLKLYPLIVVCLLMAIISGFIVWSLETWYNEEEFPRSFMVGLFEGFWWSFVSMTTVGYGDKNVKSTPARLFSVIWILLGITMFGLTTSLITVELMKTIQPHEEDMTGSKVGVLKFRDYDASLVAQHGGIVTEAPSWNFYSDVLLLVRMMRRKQVTGFVLDKYTYTFVVDYFKWKKTNPDQAIATNQSDPTTFETYGKRKADIEFFNNFTYRTGKEYHGEQLSYGVLIKDVHVYNYFVDAIRDNRLHFNTEVGSEMNSLFPKVDNSGLFTSSGEYFVDSVVVISVILCIICLFGIIYELWKRKMKHVTKKQPPACMDVQVKHLL